MRLLKARKGSRFDVGAMLSGNPAVFILLFLLIFIAKWSTLTNPPLWDEAFSVFPAAGFLVEHRFSYALLLDQAPYHQGGPAAHGFSLHTFFVAALMSLLGDRSLLWASVRLAQWGLAAGTVLLLMRMIHDESDRHRVSSFLIALCVMFHPVFLAQLGFMYLEIPVLFFTVLSLYFLKNEKYACLTASFFVAVLVKPSALILLFPICFVIILHHYSIRKALLLIIAVCAAPIAFVFWSIAAIPAMPDQAGLTFYELVRRLHANNIHVYRVYLLNAPDHILFLGLSFCAAIPVIVSRVKNYFRKTKEDLDYRPIFSAFVLGYALFYFLLYNYLQRTDTHYLTRYYMLVYPFALVLSLDVIKKLFRMENRRYVCYIGLLLLVLLINRRGILYPSLKYPSVAIAERSEEYMDAAIVTADYMRYLREDIPDDVPIYAALPDFFYSQYPSSGYVDRPMRNVARIGDLTSSAEYPARFYLVYQYPWLGGQAILYVLRNPETALRYEVHPRHYAKRNTFEAYVFELVAKEEF